jgi:hypothetical protein
LDETACLVLPVRAPRSEDEALVPFGLPEGAPPLRAEILRTASRRRWMTRDTVRNAADLVDQNDVGKRRLVDHGLEYESTRTDTFHIAEGKPLSAMARCERSVSIGRGDWRTHVETTSTLTADHTHFHLTNQLDAFEGEVRVFARTWHCRVPRDHV